MHDDMPIEQLAQDSEWVQAWMTAILSCLKKGLTFRVIHNVDRPFHEMMLGFEAYIPMYMTGQISPYYFPSSQSNVFNHFLKVSGAAALEGCAIAGKQSDGKYVLYRSKEDLRHYRRRAQDMLNKARAGKYAVGQFNINNLEWTKAILLTAQELQSPVILGVSEGAGKYMCGYKTVVGMVKGMIEELNITVPVALHLDHGTFEGAQKCILAGFSSIMFDGSHLPFEENVEKTTILKNTCDVLGISLEAEVGAIGGEEDGVIGKGECADPEECKTVADLGVTMLAAGIGNIHGAYPENWEGLSFETLDAINKRVNEGRETPMPLVLHGGTGIPDDQIKKAISLGVAKINVNTECQWAFQEATRKYIEDGKDKQGKGFDPRKLLAPGFEAIKAKVKEKMELFGSVGKAND